MCVCSLALQCITALAVSMTFHLVDNKKSLLTWPSGYRHIGHVNMPGDVDSLVHVDTLVCVSTRALLMSTGHDLCTFYSMLTRYGAC